MRSDDLSHADSDDNDEDQLELDELITEDDIAIDMADEAEDE
jgi:hypothetical protein